MSKWSKAFWLDWIERVGSVAVYSLIALVTTSETTPLDVKQLWPVLGLPVVLSALKGLLANLANPESGASVLSTPPGPVVVDDAPARNEFGYGALELVLVVLVVLILVFVLLRVAG